MLNYISSGQAIASLDTVPAGHESVERIGTAHLDPRHVLIRHLAMVIRPLAIGPRSLCCSTGPSPTKTLQL